MTDHDPRNPTGRFSHRVDDYVRSRPDYPPEVLSLLERETGLRAGSIVADLGSGTGIFTRRLLDHGCVVHAVEPNEEMRRAAEAALHERRGFFSHAATAEATGLAVQSVDFVTAAQAFHWFVLDAATREIARILRPDGRLILVWNSRRTSGTPFLEGYEKLLLEHGTDYRDVEHRGVQDGRLRAWLARLERRELHQDQPLDFDGLRGRLLSNSYVPGPGDPRREPMLADLRRLFDHSAESGRVVMSYDVEIFFGSAPPAG